MAVAVNTSRNFSFIFILLLAKFATRVSWIAAIMVVFKAQLVLAAVEVLRLHAVEVGFV